MKKLLYYLLISSITLSCAVSRKVHKDEIAINFVDEYILASDLSFENTPVGGLSGIDYKNDQFYLVSDQAANPRIYTAQIIIENRKIDSIYLTNLIRVDKTEIAPDAVLDLEAIRFDESSKSFIISSEGLIDEGKDPGIYELSVDGNIQKSYSIPKPFRTEGEQRPRNNGVFEGLTQSYDGKGYWVATELPLIKDGAKPKLYPTRSHIRFTKFDKKTGEAVRQFVYKLDGISKLPINYFAINGVTEILQYAEDKFLVLERAYSAGYGSKGNTVKIFNVDASKATNTINFQNLKGSDYEMAGKEVVFNFNSVKDQLTDGIIDNIEGMCFGPQLENGKNSLILVSDNNFNSFAEQLNQFILLEIDIK